MGIAFYQVDSRTVGRKAMETNSSPKTLEEVLGRFERALDTPVISGELPQWCENAERACNEVEKQFHKAVRENHTPLLEEIYAADPELATRVEQIRKTDGELVQRLAQMQEVLHGLTDAATVVERDEVRLDDQVEDAIQAGLELVMAVRRQEVTLTTWHGEALERDRGPVD